MKKYFIKCKVLSLNNFIYIHTYRYIYIFYIYIRNVSVATDERPSPKWALSEGGSRGSIESYLQMWFELGHYNNLAMTWASWSLDTLRHSSVVRTCSQLAWGCGFVSHWGQLSIWNRKALAQNEYHIYRQISLHTHD